MAAEYIDNNRNNSQFKHFVSDYIIKSYANDIYKTNIRFRLELKLKQNIEFRHAMTSA